LFVDDEPQILQGLSHRLRRWRKVWDMVFVNSGREALAVLDAETVDIVVADLRMPRMDGVTLLRKVRQKDPRVVRIVLSGEPDLKRALSAVVVAHQFLSKPCAAGVLEDVLERAVALKGLLDNPILQSVVGKIGSLPTLPRVYAQLMAKLGEENVSCDGVAQVLKQDMALCAKLLQAVNSAFFRVSRSVSKIEEAVAYLGFNTIKQLVLAVEVFSHPNDGAHSSQLSREALQQHSLVSANIAARMFKQRQLRESAFVAALVHDVGKLLLATELPDDLDAVAVVVRGGDEPMHAVEEQLWGVTHAEIGAYLLGIWGLPYPVVEAVANHHAPNRVKPQRFDILAAVHVADSLANELAQLPILGVQPAVPQMDHNYLGGLGVQGQLETWRELALEETSATPGLCS